MLLLFVCLSSLRKLQNSLQPPPFHSVVPHFHLVVSFFAQLSPFLLICLLCPKQLTHRLFFLHLEFSLVARERLLLRVARKNPKPSPKGVYTILYVLCETWHCAWTCVSLNITCVCYILYVFKVIITLLCFLSSWKFESFFVISIL